MALNKETRRGQGEIIQIHYLPRSLMIALLNSSNFINIVRINDLGTHQEIKNRKVAMFCVNSAIYSNDTSRNRNQALMDQLCIVTTDKALFFYEMKDTFKFEETKTSSDKGIQIGMQPSQILWDNDLIYLASKKAYMIIKKDGTVVQSVNLIN